MMRPTRMGMAAVSVCAMTVSFAVMATVDASAAPTGVAVWLTTPDRSNQLTQQPASTLRNGDAGLPTIVVDPARTYQPIEGLGASITESAARLITASANRDALMRALFDRDNGIGLNYLRQPMGASDFVAGPHYTYDDMPAGETDYAMSRFSIDHDRAEILPLLRQARQLNPELKVMAVPWSPPAWMKTGGSLIGGQLIDDDRVYQAYARYFVRFLADYAAAGVPVETLSVQNEPQNRHPKQYPGTDLRPEHEIRLIRILGPALRAAGLTTRIVAFDHNWALHPDDLSATDPPDPQYARSALRSPGPPAHRRRRLPLLLRRPVRPVRPAPGLPRCGHLLHRMLGHRVGPAGQHLP